VLNVKYKTWKDNAFNSALQKINVMDYENEGYMEIVYANDESDKNDIIDNTTTLLAQSIQTKEENVEIKNAGIRMNKNVYRDDDRRVFMTEIQRVEENLRADDVNFEKKKASSRTFVSSHLVSPVHLNVRKPASFSKPTLLSPQKLLSSSTLRLGNATRQYFGKDVPHDPIFGKESLVVVKDDRIEDMGDPDNKEKEAAQIVVNQTVALDDTIKNNRDKMDENENIEDQVKRKGKEEVELTGTSVGKKEVKSTPMPPTSPISSMSSPPHRSKKNNELKMMSMTYPNKSSVCSPTRTNLKGCGIARLGSPKAMTILGLSSFDNDD